MKQKKMKIEICCASVSDCMTAKKCGAHRVELISAHQLGGITTTAGTLYAVKNKVDIEIAAIIRPRMAGFYYSEDEFEIMCYDTKQFIDLGVDGIVFGFLKEDSTLDYERCAKFMDLIGDRESVFHRAIDITKEPHKAIEQLISLGVTRVLTSGFHASSFDGMENIRQLQEQYGDKIEIMAGGGINEENITDVVNYTKVNQVHFGGTSWFQDPSCLYNGAIPFGATIIPPNACYIGVSEDRLQKIIQNLDV